MEAYFELYPEEKGFYVFEDGNVFFLKDRNLAEKHKHDTKQDYKLVERSVEEEKSKSTTKKTK